MWSSFNMRNHPGLKIRQIRVLKGFSQDYMASMLSVSQRAYGKMERGEIKMDLNKISEIAAIFETDPISLISFNDELLFSATPSEIKSESSQNPLPQKLVELYEKRIAALESEVLFLRALLSKK